MVKPSKTKPKDNPNWAKGLPLDTFVELHDFFTRRFGTGLSQAGMGGNGTVFVLPDNRVIKLTIAPREIQCAQAIFAHQIKTGKVHPHLPRIFEVVSAFKKGAQRQIPPLNMRGYFIDNDEEDLLEQINGGFVDGGELAELKQELAELQATPIEAAGYYIREDLPEEAKGTQREFVQELNKLQVYERIEKELGLSLQDYDRIANWGMRDGSPVFRDLDCYTVGSLSPKKPIRVHVTLNPDEIGETIEVSSGVDATASGVHGDNVEMRQWLAEMNDGEVYSTLLSEQLKQTKHPAYIENIAISQAQRSVGLGSLLLTQLEAEFSSRGVDWVGLQALAEPGQQARLESWYKKHGYMVVPDSRRGSSSSVYMTKWLNKPTPTQTGSLPDGKPTQIPAVGRISRGSSFYGISLRYLRSAFRGSNSSAYRKSSGIGFRVVLVVDSQVGTVGSFSTNPVVESAPNRVVGYQGTSMFIVKSDADFVKAVSKPGLAVMAFVADWCGHCQQFKPTLKRLNDTYGHKINVIQVDMDKCPQAKRVYQVSAVPTVYVGETGYRSGAGQPATLNPLFVFHGGASLERLVAEIEKHLPAKPGSVGTVGGGKNGNEFDQAAEESANDVIQLARQRMKGKSKQEVEQTVSQIARGLKSLLANGAEKKGKTTKGAAKVTPNEWVANVSRKLAEEVIARYTKDIHDVLYLVLDPPAGGEVNWIPKIENTEESEASEVQADNLGKVPRNQTVEQVAKWIHDRLRRSAILPSTVGGGLVGALPWEIMPNPMADPRVRGRLHYRATFFEGVSEDQLPMPTLGEGWVLQNGEWLLVSKGPVRANGRRPAFSNPHRPTHL